MLTQTEIEQYRAKAISLFPFLKDVSFTIARLPAGRYLFTEGDQCAQAGFVVEGVIRVFKTGHGNREVTLYRLFEGESCSLALTCALSSYMYQASAVVEKEAVVAFIPLTTLHWLIQHSSAARQFIFELLAGRFFEVLSLVGELVFRRLDERLAQLLLEFAEQQDDRFIVSRSHEELAYELGSAREVISRLLKSFEQNGWVELQRRMVVLRNVRALQRKARGLL